MLTLRHSARAKGKKWENAKVTAPPADVDEQFNFELTLVVSQPRQDEDVMNQLVSCLPLDCKIEEMFSLKTAHASDRRIESAALI